MYLLVDASNGWNFHLGVSHACKIEDSFLILNYWDHIGAMFGPYQGHVLANSTIALLLDA